MKIPSFDDFLMESFKEEGIVCADIDDTILRTSIEDIGIIKYKNGKYTRLNTYEFAKDSDKGDPNVIYDYSEFDDPIKIKKSILNGTPLLGNLKIIDFYIRKGYKFAFLTARGCEDVIKDTMSKFMMFRDTSGELKMIGKKFNKTLSYAINDPKYIKVWPHLKDFERKATVIKNIAKQYKHVVFIDDDEKNLQAVQKLGISNVDVIKALNEEKV